MALAFLLGYLVGSLPIAFWFGTLRGRNLLQEGSGNPGALNAYRLLGPVPGLMVLFLDVFKGVLAVALGEGAAGSPWGGLAGGVGAVWGHAFSPWLLLRGARPWPPPPGSSWRWTPPPPGGLGPFRPPPGPFPQALPGGLGRGPGPALLGQPPAPGPRPPPFRAGARPSRGLAPPEGLGPLVSRGGARCGSSCGSSPKGPPGPRAPGSESPGSGGRRPRCARRPGWPRTAGLRTPPGC